MEPISPPTSIPTYTPISPMLNTNPRRHAKIKTNINSLNVVKASANVPFPSPWKTFDAVAPN